MRRDIEQYRRTAIAPITAVDDVNNDDFDASAVV